MMKVSLTLLCAALSVIIGCSNDPVEPYKKQYVRLFNGNSGKVVVLATEFDTIYHGPVPFGESRSGYILPSGDWMKFTITDSAGKILTTTNNVQSSRLVRSTIVIYTGTATDPDAFVSTAEFAGRRGVRIVHASSPTSSFKLYSNSTQGQLLSASLSYGASTPYILNTSRFDSLIVVDQNGLTVRTIDFPEWFDAENQRSGCLILYGDVDDANVPLSLGYVDETPIS